MWFKNLALLRFTEPFHLSAEQLEEKLTQGRFRPCGSLEPHSFGWCPPVGGDGGMLVHVSNGYLMLCFQKEEKILPSAVVNETLQERIDAVVERTGNKPGKKERDRLRDDVLQELLPRAFSHSKRTYAYIDPKGGWLIIDSSSANRAEELASYLRRCIDTLPVSPPATKDRPADVMTAWLNDGVTPPDVVLDSECELRAAGDQEGGIVRCKRQDLMTPEVQNHLKAGKEVVRMAISWNDRLSFVLDESLGIKRLRFLDLVQEQAAEIDAADAVEQFDVDFSIMSLELSAFLPRLLELFGGENGQQKH